MTALATYPIVTQHSALYERVQWGPNRSDYYLRETQHAKDRELERQSASAKRVVRGRELLRGEPLDPLSSRFD